MIFGLVTLSSMPSPPLIDLTELQSWLNQYYTGGAVKKTEISDVYRNRTIVFIRKSSKAALLS